MHELDYMFNAVDPIKAMHLLPPSLLDGYQQKPGVTVSDGHASHCLETTRLTGWHA